MSGQKTIEYASYLASFLILAALCFPAIQISSTLPTVHALDVFFPLLCYFVFKLKPSGFRPYFVLLPILFSCFVLFTIVVQHHASSTSDYFEVYKWIKYAVALLFFCHVDFTIVKKFILWIFALLVFINTIHFFSLFHINELIQSYYNGGIHIQFFGKNSEGAPAVKRLVGTMGNPNINALLFGVFSIYFFPIVFKWKKVILFFVSLLFMFLCQSRTSLLVLAAMILLVMFFFTRIWTKKQWLLILIGIALTFFLSWMFATSFFQYTSYNNSLLDGSALYSGSARGRFETWNLLGHQIMEQPLFGHGPYKNYFYVNAIHSENEYILMLWRYGIIGFLFYLSIYLLPFRKFIKDREPKFLPILLFLTLMMVSALTNNPLTERNIELLFCIGLAWSFQCYVNQKEHSS